ncbi:AMP-binding protein [Holdemania massiliensis]|uniref:AMP-binding protein n=1 Tax=Holdemania massiliensis TaxID=1468449 RepID=A0A6N7S9D9_9FIRM|nr:AMP-binding protein [Holdemania massiliensis]MSA72248.1 AMP-binding protein [Holdemania massiliensis]MSA90524.1 AMP-binding protein [Holdemania massiliensis]MSB79330.1 AMP-binding protein [Holdemania massiliensis]MSC34254.1 AMP-binding protein [Holdemania massiliensis]MSC40644.1 AMP-binding protein [Holdemania massiliensis]
MRTYPNYPADTYPTFRCYLEGIKSRFGAREAIVSFSPRGERFSRTYRQLAEDVQALSEAFRLFLPEGQAAILSENSYGWLITYLALILSGRTAVCLDTEQPEEIVTEMIRHTDCTAVFVSPSFLPLTDSLRRQCPKLQKVLRLSYDEDDSIKALWLKGLTLVREHQSSWSFPDHDGSFTASIVYTSGTTSVSKPVMLSEAGILLNAADSMRLVSIADTMYTSLPFYHTYGLTCSVINILLHGSTLCINGSLKTMLRDLKTFAPENMMAVPLIVEMMHQNIWRTLKNQGQEAKMRNYLKLYRIVRRLGFRPFPAFLKPIRAAFGGRLNMIVCGGAHLSETIGLEMEAFGFQIIQGYGITECSPLISVNRNLDSRVDTVGHVLPGIELRLIQGEIAVRGASVMQGYYKNEALSQEVFDQDWFLTGDLGSLDSRGHLRITGRKKNLIVFKNGKKVSPEEIEQHLIPLPLVKEVMAYGMAASENPDDVRLTVMIYPDPQAAEGMSAYEILEQLQADVDQVNQQLPSYKQIQMIKLRETEFEKTATRKIKRTLMPERRSEA